MSRTDSAHHTFQINALVLDFSTASLTGFQSGGPTDGVLVDAMGATPGALTVRMRAQIDALDATLTPNTLTVLGVKVAVTGLTRFEDRSHDHVTTFGLADLQRGQWIEVRGHQSPAGSNQLTANSIESVQAESLVELGGPVKTATQPLFTILAVPVTSTGATAFSGATGTSMTATAFFTGLVGQFADVHGTWDGTTLTARSATLSSEED